MCSLLFNCVKYFGNIAKSWCTSMNLNKYYGYVYVSADNVKSNMNYQRYLNQMKLPLYSKQKKKFNLHIK
jgi:hypothetical protein